MRALEFQPLDSSLRWEDRSGREPAEAVLGEWEIWAGVWGWVAARALRVRASSGKAQGQPPSSLASSDALAGLW